MELYKKELASEVWNLNKDGVKYTYTSMGDRSQHLIEIYPYLYVFDKDGNLRQVSHRGGILSELPDAEAAWDVVLEFGELMLDIPPNCVHYSITSLHHNSSVTIENGVCHINDLAAMFLFPEFKSFVYQGIPIPETEEQYEKRTTIKK